MLILDWDFDAPGVPVKFDVQDEVRNGYVDYLFDVRDEYGQDIKYTNLEEREKYLKDCIIRIKDENIYILPAGNRSNKNYWLHTSSLNFQSFFNYSDSGETNKNTNFFTEDIEILKNSLDEKEVDYLVIDCKAGDARAVIPLMLFADKVVELFNCNNEGVFGELLTRSAIQRLNDIKKRYGEKKEGVVLISTMSRVPSKFTVAHALKEYKDFASQMLNYFDISIDGIAKDLLLIHEHRGLEIAESLILDKDNKDFLLSHDYIELFEEILSDDIEIKEKISSLGFIDWKTAIGLADQVEFIERFFSLQVLKGNLFNDDNVRNVAIRCDTLRDMLNGLGKDISDHLQHAGINKNTIKSKIENSFCDAGCRAGEGFGIEAITPGKVWPDVPTKTQDRLEGWLAFDRDAGFGNWTCRLDENKKICVIILQNHFLSGTEYGEYFLFGYIKGVLSYLIPGKDDPVAIEFKSYKNKEVTLAYV